MLRNRLRVPQHLLLTSEQGLTSKLAKGRVQRRRWPRHRELLLWCPTANANQQLFSSWHVHSPKLCKK